MLIFSDEEKIIIPKKIVSAKLFGIGGTMKIIKRDRYLQKLIDRRENGSIKVITGIRRCGKSFLLFNLFRDYLINDGVSQKQVIAIALDSEENENLQNREELSSYIRSITEGGGTYYIFLDEVQLCEGFEKVLNSLNRNQNFDIYVTGSNSKFLSSDILTEFRGRGDEVRVYPLSFFEYYAAYGKDKNEAWKEYFVYGGLPLILSKRSDEQKSKYLKDLFEKTYLADIVERNNLRGDNVMDALVNTLASGVGSLTNPSKLANTFVSNGIKVTDKTIRAYIDYLLDAFVIIKADRFDVKGKQYITTPSKYYFSDVGLRNARINFRQQEENHIMENIIFNELLIRDFDVDVGIIKHFEAASNGKKTLKSYEIDFVCNRASERYYIQSAFAIPDEAKMEQETRSLHLVPDSFKKIVIVKDDIKLWRTEDGITVMGLFDFLLNQDSLSL